MQSSLIQSDGKTLLLNDTLKKWIGCQKEFIAFISGDNLIIKKKSSILDFASNDFKDQMTENELNFEIHQSRKS